MNLTKKQFKVLTFIQQFQEGEGYSPTLKLIAEAMGVSSLSTVFKHLKALEQRGYIDRHPGRCGIVVLPERDRKPTATGFSRAYKQGYADGVADAKRVISALCPSGDRQATA